MAFGAIMMIFVKKIWKTDTEIQRYIYQKTRFESENPGCKWGTFHIQKEIFMQAYANFGILLLPGVLVCNDTNPLTALEICGFVMWVCSYIFESVSDK